MYPRHYFDLFRPHISEKMVFVGMAFGELSRWGNIIKPAISEAGLEPYRVDMDVPSDSVLEDIMRGILDAKFLLFDISMDAHGVRNGNVMYEIGLAHAMRHPEEILIIRSDRAPLLFDVANIRIHSYDLDQPHEARGHLTRLLQHLTAGMTSLHGLILDKIVGSLDEVCLGFLASHANLTHFSLTDPTKAFEPETIAGRAAVRHLLDQGVVTLKWSKEEYSYAYTWTYMGKAVLQYLGFVTGEESEPGQQLYNYDGRGKDREKNDSEE